MAVCLAMPCIFGARADNDGDAVRAAARRGATTTTATTTQSRQKTAANSTTNAQSTRDTATIANRAVTTGAATAATQSRGAIANVSARENANTTTSSRAATTGSVVSRTGASTVAPRANANTTTASRTSVRTTGAVQSRATPTTRAATNATRQSRAAATGAISRAATTGATSTSRRTATTGGARQSRAAATASTAAIAPGNYKECRTVYYECMDEFCANKDTQLRRCACSSRMSEFDGLKEQMTKIEDKLLDFNQRLLTVNMDKEDALAINTATEGELAFNQADKSDSKKMLDEISKKLNDTFKNTKLDSSLSAINLSLDMDSAFDNLDSMMGASTVTKSGTQLYSAALPVCREMAAEVCSDDELSIAESGYQMMIEQDCNTVAKAYSSQAETAREKIREGGALLDMSRLNIYQTRNSDDILTCKSKMLEMLSDSTVCGTNLGKCLDTSGKYIDPSTGEAFLSQDLSQLATLLTRPTGDQTWTSAPGNEKFVTFLGTKKKFLTPAMENCQDIADAVWDEFIEDALAQIKLAQDSKLEDMRQSCTQLVAQCMTDTAKSISDFDARALSTFGVMADKTVREMCSQIQTACTALLNNTGGGATEWSTGIDNITTDKTEETLLYTCREVGKNCIIQTCKSASGNFGLCSDIQASVNRKSIINRRACWDEVRACINAAGTDMLRKIVPEMDNDNQHPFYTDLYGNDRPQTIISNKNQSTPYSTRSISEYDSIFDICATDCGLLSNTDNNPELNSDACIECRLTERIWGNCELDPSVELDDKNVKQNKILMTGDNHTGTDTLLAWFADKTGTVNNIRGCVDTSCPTGMRLFNGGCVTSTYVTTSNEVCPTNQQFDVYDGLKNCCAGANYNTDDSKKHTGSVCAVTEPDKDYTTGDINGNITVVPLQTKEDDSANAVWWYVQEGDDNKLSDSNVRIVIPGTAGTAYQTVAKFTVSGKGTHYLICVGTLVANSGPTSCNGDFIIATEKGVMLLPTQNDVGTAQKCSDCETGTSTSVLTKEYSKPYDRIRNYYIQAGGKNGGGACEYNKDWCDSNNTPTSWKVEYIKPKTSQ